PALPVVPGHQVVGIVDACGDGVSRNRCGERVGVGWIHRSCGGARENLSEEFTATGRDVDGGYADYMLADEAYAYPIPATFEPATAAPLLCAGAVGYRALKLSRLVNGEALGLTGFGGSAHLLLPFVRHHYPDSHVHVFARHESTQRFATTLGAHSAGHTDADPPLALDAIIDTTPVWRPVVKALARLAPAGRLVINAIRKQDDDKASLLEIDYARDLWLEKSVQSVANVTAADLAEYLPLAAAAKLSPTVTTYPLADANAALRALKFEPVRGSYVLLP
ncbi:MAG: alcohol dehydrogenase catalytic domain-containing protein, partial [Pseudomonadota bacterium]